MLPDPIDRTGIRGGAAVARHPVAWSTAGRLTSITVPARQEREVCQAVALPNDRPIDVAALQFASPGGLTFESHHFALFVDDLDTIASLPHGAARDGALPAQRRLYLPAAPGGPLAGQGARSSSSRA